MLYFDEVSMNLCVWQHLVHQFSVLSVDASDGSDVLTAVHGLIQLRVLQHQHIFIRHEHLEGVYTFLSHQHLHLPAHLNHTKQNQFKTRQENLNEHMKLKENCMNWIKKIKLQYATPLLHDFNSITFYCPVIMWCKILK